METTEPIIGDPPIMGTELFRLDGSVALVTGASSGLGARFARVLAHAGADVYAAARRVELLKALTERDRRIRSLPLDVTDRSGRERSVAAVMAKHGRVDVLVNCAGVSVPGPAETASLDDFRRTFEVNVVGLFGMTQLVARSMLEQEAGSIVNIASMFGLVAAAPLRDAAYTATKGAVVNLTRELAVQWARRGVRVNALAPGFFPSEMVADMFEDEASMRWLRSNAPMNRPGAPDELDGALLFLCSRASQYVTGHILTVDGGWTAH